MAIGRGGVVSRLGRSGATNEEKRGRLAGWPRRPLGRSASKAAATGVRARAPASSRRNSASRSARSSTSPASRSRTEPRSGLRVSGAGWTLQVAPSRLQPGRRSARTSPASSWPRISGGEGHAARSCARISRSGRPTQQARSADSFTTNAPSAAGRPAPAWTRCPSASRSPRASHHSGRSGSASRSSRVALAGVFMPESSTGPGRVGLRCPGSALSVLGWSPTMTRLAPPERCAHDALPPRRGAARVGRPDATRPGLLAAWRERRDRGHHLLRHLRLATAARGQHVAHPRRRRLPPPGLDRDRRR